MACYVPFNDRNLDISFFMLRPTVVYVDELVEALKHISSYTESLGCVHSSILRSIHGNLIIWYGAWMKRSTENKRLLSAALVSMLTNVSSMAILVEHSFFNAYSGESRDGSPAAKFFTGDIVSLSSASLSADDLSVSYESIAMFKDSFGKMNGASCGVCLKCEAHPRIACLFVWKSLQHCYSYILGSDYRKAILPSLEVKYDVFKVAYVSGDHVLNIETMYAPNTHSSVVQD
ncbi:hypothetical protein F511_01826 [Dorcoceras hygrometricum]|uniref:DUF7392 domain-containing protein n=1 Tax=Dorcoceras hygrometricum TaxID=472368 RepID=A0A2Z7D1Y8_9LAMI|nr:hypothetical protein F511_01826 [Dorcoceras hygrometricum]